MPKPSLAPSILQAMLQDRLGRISTLRSIAEGLDSQAFSFWRDRTGYVVRINDSIDGFAKDRFVHRRFANPALPIPPVVDIGWLDDAHAFCISEQMPGFRVREVEDLQRPGLVDPILQLLATLAGADLRGTHGFGRFDADGVGPCTGWRDFLRGIADPQRHDWTQVAHRVHLPLIRHGCRLIAELAEHCPETRGLIHGDFGSDNLLTDGRRITGIIDWDRALFGDPLYDVANVLFWGESSLQPLIGVLEQQGLDLPRWRKRVMCYQLRIGLQEIYESAMGTTPVDLDWLIGRCEVIVEASSSST